MNWTAAADQLLMTLWQEGRSMADIADELETSRGAIAGRKRRLSERGHPFAAREPAFPFKAAELPKRNGVVLHDDGIDYLQLGPDGCKAILDKRGKDGLWMCCGKPRQRDKPYCPGHVAAYGPPDKRSEHSWHDRPRT